MKLISNQYHIKYGTWFQYVLYIMLFLTVSLLQANDFYYYDSFNNKVYPKVYHDNYLSYDISDELKVLSVLKILNVEIKDGRKYKNTKILELNKEITDKSLFIKENIKLYHFFGKNNTWPVVINNRGVVQLDEGYNIEKLSKEFDFKIISYIESIDLYIIEYKFDILPLLNELKERKIAKISQPDFLIPHEKRFIPNDLYFNHQWHLYNDGSISGTVSGADIKAVDAWDIEMGSPNIKISIVDDGMDVNHPDLSSKIIAKHDFIGDDEDVGNHVDGESVHGTACAGVASAIGDNNEGVIGSCPNCSLIAAKMMGGENNNYNPSTISAQAIIWSSGGRVENVESIESADIISCSWGFTQSFPIPSPLKQAIDFAVNNGRDGKGSVVVFASGNDGREYDDNELEAYKNIITVGASTDKDTRAGYSNYGVKLDLLAPSNGGRNSIWTTDYQGGIGYNFGMGPDNIGNYTSTFGGTSSATPLVSGVIGLILSKKPSLKWYEVRDILRASSDKINTSSVTYKDGWNKYYGYGRLNAYKALKLTDEDSFNDIGENCEEDSDCSFFCFKETQGWKYGYCSNECSFNYCMEGSTCSKIVGIAIPSCLKNCESVLDCKDGYRCNKLNEADTSKYCIPGCSVKGCRESFSICEEETQECVDDIENLCWDELVSAPKNCNVRHKSCNQDNGLCECEDGFFEVESGECAKDMCLDAPLCRENSKCESITGLCLCNDGYEDKGGKCSKISRDASCNYGGTNQNLLFFLIFLIWFKKKLSSLNF